jgi:hypothetical protein
MRRFRSLHFPKIPFYLILIIIKEMAYWAATAVGSAFWLLAAKSIDMRARANEPEENKSQQSDEKEPFQGAWEPVKQYWNSTTRWRFNKVVEDTDVQGAKIYIVDYGNGARTIQYHDPRLLL